MHFDFSRIKRGGYYGVALVIAFIAFSFVLLYALMHNPYKDIHTRVFEIAGKVNNYYREKPSYWKLSTKTAEEDNLIGDIRESYEGYDFSIGQGANGEECMPSDASFDIALKHLSKSACISLSEYPLPEKERLSLIKITINANGKVTEFSWGEESKLPVEKYAARDVCAAKENTIIWTFQ